MARRDLSGCLGCVNDGRCDLQADRCRQALFSYPAETIRACPDREDRWWRGIEGVVA